MKKLIVTIALALLAGLMLIPTPAQAAPRTPAVVCQKAEATAKIRLRQPGQAFVSKDFYIDMIQGYEYCLNRLGPNYIKPTYYRWRYQSPHNISCTPRSVEGFTNGYLEAVRIRPSFYDSDGNRVATGAPVKLKCDPDEKGKLGVIWGRYGSKTWPKGIYWRTSSRVEAPAIRAAVGIDWRWGTPNAVGVIAQKLPARPSA